MKTMKMERKKNTGKRKLAKWIFFSLACLITAMLIALPVVANMMVDIAISRSAVNDGKPVKQKPEVLELLRRHPFSEEYILSDDGLDLYGKVYMAPQQTSKWVVALHGRTTNSDIFVEKSVAFAEKGFNVLAPDMRAHGYSDGGYTGMGWLDRKDVLRWIGFILEKDPFAEIALYGVSMGGAAVMMAVGEQLPPNIKCAVEDCGYTTVYDEFYYQMGQDYKGVPRFPLLKIVSLLAKLRAGYGFEEASSVSQLKNCKIPMLFIHGDQDTYVPFEMLQRVYDADVCADKDMLVVQGAGHDESSEVDPDLYWGAIFSFLDKHM